MSVSSDLVVSCNFSPHQVRAALRDADANLEIVSTEEQRDEAIALATEQEDWLYDDGWDMDAATYRQKRAELAQVRGRDPLAGVVKLRAVGKA